MRHPVFEESGVIAAAQRDRVLNERRCLVEVVRTYP